MRLLRWATNVISLIMIGLFGYAIVHDSFVIGATTGVGQRVFYGLIGVGVLLAVFWKGMGELVGAMALLGGALWLLSLTGYSPGALTGIAPFALVGALFFVCGLSELFREPQPARHAIA